MDDTVTKLKPVSVGDNYVFDADAILEGAKGHDLETIVIVGQRPNGDLWLSSAVNAGTSLILLHRAINQIVGGD